MTIKKFISFLIIMSLISSCASVPGERKFGRYKGRALRFGIPLYEGVPPAEFQYKDLGYLEGKYQGKLFIDSAGSIISNALEDLANKAKAIGANAVIEVEPFNEPNRVFRYTGRAVIFEKLPDS
jgi:hypothetical protein